MVQHYKLKHRRTTERTHKRTHTHTYTESERLRDRDAETGRENRETLVLQIDELRNKSV